MPTAAIQLPRTAVLRAGKAHQAVDEQENAANVQRHDVRDRLAGVMVPCASRERCSLGGLLLAFEHAEHAVGDGEAADHVERAEHQRDER